jgi:hypothetical protein
VYKGTIEGNPCQSYLELDAANATAVLTVREDNGENNGENCVEHDTHTIAVTGETPDPTAGGDDGTQAEAPPSCESQGGSTSWFACPLIEGMLGAMQGITNFMAEILNLRPISATPNDPIFVVWSSVRNIALVVLVIAVLISIFGQTLGVDAYTIKKMVPRIGVAALAILLSFYVSAILIDFFNILGNGAQALMFSTLEDMPISVGLGSEWAGAILAGIGVGGSLVLLLNPATLATLGLILMPVLLAFLTAIAVVILRQVVIIGLVIASPLAFACWILPNTEKWFKRWYGIFSTMLMMYPIIMVLLGAGAMYAVIITNNGSLNSGEGITSSNFANYLLAIAGIGVSMAAVPFTLRASSGILRGITGAINNPNRGVFDRARKGLQGVRQRNMDQRKQDRLAALREGKTMGGKDFKKFSPTRALYRASTGTMGKFAGGGKYADLNREQKEAEALSSEQQMARAKTKKLRIPLEDLQVELEAGRIPIRMRELEDNDRRSQIEAVMKSHERDNTDFNQLVRLAGSAETEEQRIGAALRLSQTRQHDHLSLALANMATSPGGARLAAETVNRDFGTINEFAPELTGYATGVQRHRETGEIIGAGRPTYEAVAGKPSHLIGAASQESVRDLVASGSQRHIMSAAQSYIEADSKNQPVNVEAAEHLSRYADSHPTIFTEDQRNHLARIARRPGAAWTEPPREPRQNALGGIGTVAYGPPSPPPPSPPSPSTSSGGGGAGGTSAGGSGTSPGSGSSPPPPSSSSQSQGPGSTFEPSSPPLPSQADLDPDELRGRFGRRDTGIDPDTRINPEDREI